MYLPSLDRYKNLTSDHFSKIKRFASWKSSVRNNWGSMHIQEVKIEDHAKLLVGNTLTVGARIDLGQLKPEDVSVELYYGNLNARGEIETPRLVLMKNSAKPKDSVYDYSGTIALDTSGRIGHTVRILPRHEDLDNPFKPGLIHWA